MLKEVNQKNVKQIKINIMKTLASIVANSRKQAGSFNMIFIWKPLFQFV